MIPPSRNDLCPCGSGKKFKRCHGALTKPPTPGSAGNSVHAAANLLNRAQQCFQQGNLYEAERLCRESLGIAPENFQSYLGLGLILGRQGRKPEAIAALRKALQLNPAHVETIGNLGLLLFDIGEYHEAEQVFRRGVAVKSSEVGFYINLGAAQIELQKLDSAVASLREAVRINPSLPEAHIKLGFALYNLGQYEESAACCRKAIKLNPSVYDAYINLGAALIMLREYDEAEAISNKALALDRNRPEALHNLGNSLKEKGQAKEASAAFQQAVALCRNPITAHKIYSSLFILMQSDPTQGPEAMRQQYRRHASLVEPANFREPQRSNKPDPERQLKIGYVSGDFRRHVVATFFEPILENHQHSGFHITCYHNSLVRDEVTERLNAAADAWVDCKAMSDAALAESIQRDGIDILVDLSGYTVGNRLLMFTRKPAPIQITYLGHPGSTGLSAMDYRISDHYADPPENEGYYTEKLLRLPGSLWCYRPRPGMPEITPLPALVNGHLTFGSFNSFNKIHDCDIALWARLLHETPGSRLLVVTVPEGEVRQRFLDKLATLGIAEDRITLRPQLPLDEFFPAIQQADIALEPMRVNGATTACDALWLGVPTLSVTGSRFLSRFGFSVLSAAGQAKFAVGSEDALIALAQHYAQNLPVLAQERATMRARVAQSSLVNEQAFTVALENLYRQVWRDWCAGR